MLRVRYNQRNVQKRIVVALALLCLMTCAVDVQLYLEHQITVSIAACHRPDQHEDYFNMSLNELMNVVVVSGPDARPTSLRLDLYCFHSNWT